MTDATANGIEYNWLVPVYCKWNSYIDGAIAQSVNFVLVNTSLGSLHK